MKSTKSVFGKALALVLVLALVVTAAPPINLRDAAGVATSRYTVRAVDPGVFCLMVETNMSNQDVYNYINVGSLFEDRKIRRNRR